MEDTPTVFVVMRLIIRLSQLMGKLGLQITG